MSIIKYIKLYNERHPSDQVLISVLETICEDKRLYNAFERPLRNDVGIKLHEFCKDKVSAPEVAFLQGTRVDSFSPRASAIPRASRVPKKPGVIARRDEVSPGGRFVNTSDEDLYVRQDSFGRGLKKHHRKTKRLRTRSKTSKNTRRKNTTRKG